MLKTIISPLVHSPDEHSIVAMPDNESAQKIVTIQTKFKLLLGDSIWLTPPNALHSTLMEIICNTEYTGLTRKGYFMQWYERYNDKTRETIAQFSPIDLHFNELYVSPAAIILKAADSEPMQCGMHYLRIPFFQSKQSCHLALLTARLLAIPKQSISTMPGRRREKSL